MSRRRLCRTAGQSSCLSLSLTQCRVHLSRIRLAWSRLALKRSLISMITAKTVPKAVIMSSWWRPTETELAQCLSLFIRPRSKTQPVLDTTEMDRLQNIKSTSLNRMWRQVRALSSRKVARESPLLRWKSERCPRSAGSNKSIIKVCCPLSRPRTSMILRECAKSITSHWPKIIAQCISGANSRLNCLKKSRARITQCCWAKTLLSPLNQRIRPCPDSSTHR